MTEPFSVVALSPRTFQVKNPGDGVTNVKRINEFIDTAVMVGAWEGAPVRLVVIPEMAIQGMIANTPGNREREAHFAVTIPGPETDELAKKAVQLNTYIAAELYMVKDDDFPDRYFNVAFIIDPQGEVVYKRYKATSDAYEGGMLGNMQPARRLGRVHREEGQRQRHGRDLPGRADRDRQHRHRHLPRGRLPRDRPRVWR